MPSAAGDPPFDASIVVLDDDADMVAALRELIRVACGAECLTATTYDELVAFGERALACKVAILDINLGPGEPSGVQAYQWLQRSGFEGRIVFLTGHGQTHPLVQAAQDLGGIRILEKPAPAEALLALLQAS